MKLKYHLPIIGIVLYLKSFGPNGTKSGADEVAFAFWMAMYHACIIGIPIAILMIKLLN